MTQFDKALLDKASRIKLAVFDIDGIFTDGGLVLLENGVEAKEFNVRDGLGLVMLIKSGIEVGIITGRKSSIVTERMEHLGISLIYQGQSDKLPAFEEMLQKLNLQADDVAYMGDDLPDLCILKRVGLAVTVPEADPLVLENTHWQTSRGGGRGAVRELCELILAGQGKLTGLQNEFLHR